MAEVGSLGNVVFTVSAELVRTFSDYGRKTSARVATHEIIGQKPVLEFLGASEETISFKIKLSAFRGVNPKEEADRLREMCENGKAVKFGVSTYQTKTNRKKLIAAYSDKGNLISSELNISLREYAQRRNDNASA